MARAEVNMWPASGQYVARREAAITATCHSDSDAVATESL